MMTDFMQAVFGTYTLVDGQTNYEYIGGVLIFSIVLFCTLKIIGTVIKK